MTDEGAVSVNPLLDAFFFFSRCGELRPMLHCDNPYFFPNNTIEKSIRRNDNFPVWKTWKLWDLPPGVWKLVQPS